VKKKLLLLRHAAHEAAHHPRFYGRTDLALSEQGRLQAASIALLINKHRPDVCFCSPLKRCLETSAALSGMPTEILPDLREVDFGSWEGKTFDEMQQLNPEAVQRWADFDLQFSFPDGDRLDDFLIRIRRAASTLVVCPATTVLAVTHAGVICALLCHFLELQPRHYIHFKVDYASLTILELFGDRGVLAGLNHTCFREGEEPWDILFL
jgi:alpha-ribazole phosphatase